MAKLSIAPDRDGYSIVPKDTFISKRMTYGNSRYRADLNEADFIVTCQWTVTLTDYNTITAFMIANAALTFQMDLLILSSYIIEYDVKLVPDTFKIMTQQGEIITCSASLAVLPDLTAWDCHMNTVAIESCIGDKIDPVIRQLNFLFTDMGRNSALLV